MRIKRRPGRERSDTTYFIEMYSQGKRDLYHQKPEGIIQCLLRYIKLEVLRALFTERLNGARSMFITGAATGGLASVCLSVWKLGRRGIEVQMLGQVSRQH